MSTCRTSKPEFGSAFMSATCWTWRTQTSTVLGTHFRCWGGALWSCLEGNLTLWGVYNRGPILSDPNGLGIGVGPSPMLNNRAQTLLPKYVPEASGSMSMKAPSTGTRPMLIRDGVPCSSARPWSSERSSGVEEVVAASYLEQKPNEPSWGGGGREYILLLELL